MSLWDDKNLFDRILERLTRQERGYVKFNKARDTIVDYYRPDLGSDIKADGDGSFFGEDIYDGVATWAIGVMSAGFQGGLVSAEADWLMYTTKQSELRDNDILDLWLQNVKEHMSEVYQQSNFYRVLPPFIKDGISIGSPVLFIEEDIPSRTIKFLPQHYETVFVFYNKYNQPEGVIVKDKTWTVKQIYDRFAPSKEQAEEKLSKNVNDSIRNGKFYTEHTIIHAVFKNNDPIWDIPEFKKPNKGWISVYFEEKTVEERKNTPLGTEGFFTQPFVVWDYDKKPWESISRTPAFDAIYDVISQQQVKKQQLTNLALKNNPPRAVLSDHRNIIDFNPEGVSLIEKGDWNFSPKVIDVVGDIKLSKDELESNAETIKRWFHTDKFLKFTDLTSTLRQQPTATQIIKIAAEIAVQVGPGIGTFTGGFLRSVDARIVDIEMRAGRGPFNPNIMENIKDVVISILGIGAVSFGVIPIFTGQLARAQKVKQELDPIIEGLGILKALFEEYPDLKHAIREYDTAEDILKAVNFPLKNLKPEDEYNEIIAQLNEARARAEQQALALEMAKVAPNVSGPVDESSVLASAAGGGG